MKRNDSHDLVAVRALFILKRREDYSQDIPGFQEKTVATGMWHSATYSAQALQKYGANTKVVVVIDNNDIDREVTRFKATHVFLEGYWVVPEKLDVLKPLHPSVTWVVRCHSEIPFLAGEGIAMDWTSKYISRGVYVAGNSLRNASDLGVFADGHEGMSPKYIAMLPNSYPTDFHDKAPKHRDDEWINIGCFGAIRPLKNHLIQAIAAYAYARRSGKKLRFFINGGRVEMNGANPLKNLIGFFAPLKDAELVTIPWCNIEEFLIVLGTMDITMQVSFTESFNIVTADSLYAGTPVVASDELPFLVSGIAGCTSVASMVRALTKAMQHPADNVRKNRAGLKKYVDKSAETWRDWLKTH